MAQITIYIDDDTERRLRREAVAAGVSVSRWIADLVRTRTAASWPADVAGLAGSWREEGGGQRCESSLGSTPRDSRVPVGPLDRVDGLRLEDWFESGA